MNLPELLVIDFSILVVHENAQDASECGLLAFEDAMTKLLGGAKEVLDLGLEDTQKAT